MSFRDNIFMAQALLVTENQTIFLVLQKSAEVLVIGEHNEK